MPPLATRLLRQWTPKKLETPPGMSCRNEEKVEAWCHPRWEGALWAPQRDFQFIKGPYRRDSKLRCVGKQTSATLSYAHALAFL